MNKPPKRMTSQQIKLVRGAILLVLVCLAFSYFLAKMNPPAWEHPVSTYISGEMLTSHNTRQTQTFSPRSSTNLQTQKNGPSAKAICRC